MENTFAAPLPRFVNRHTGKFESYQDWRERLFNIIRSGVSYEGARDLLYQGRIDNNTYHAYVTVWHWLNYRLSSDKQDRFFNQFGHEAVKRRINRVRAAFGFDLLN